MPIGQILTSETELHTVTTDHAIEWAARGYEYEAASIFTLAAGATRYVGFEVPAEATDRFVALQVRFFKADVAKVDLDILWDTTSISGGTVLTPFNNHRATGRASDVIYTDNATVNTTGSQIREQDYIAGTLGQGNTASSSGQIDPATGFRIYRAGEHFVVRVTNNSGETNKIKVGYKWAEPPISELPVEV